MDKKFVNLCIAGHVGRPDRLTGVGHVRRIANLLHSIPILLLLALLRTSAAVADDSPSPAVPPRLPSETSIPEVLVTANHAGPALWKVTSGQHLLWILAEPPTPLSTKSAWSKKQVEAATAGAQELILDGGITFNSLVSAMPMSVTTYQDMRTIPGQLTSLKDVVPAGLYDRFRALKDAFAPNYDSLEHLRPWAAGFELSKHARKSLKLSDNAVSDTVLRLSWRAKVITVYTYADYAQFEKNSRSSRSVSCLEEIVSELEATRDDLQRLETAWSVGDIDTLREVALRQKPDTCVLDMFDNDQQARYVMAHHTEQWLAAAELALKTHNTAFALAPADKIFAPDGWLTALRARGYDVQEPH